MNKTIEQHFYDSMPADIAAMAIRNTDEDLLHMSICQTPAAALQKGFDWAASDQGYAFWSSVFDTVSENRDFRDLKVDGYDMAMAGLKKLHAELLKDRKRLDWLLSTQSGYSINGLGTRADIDKAMDEDWFERERHDKIMSGMDGDDQFTDMRNKLTRGASARKHTSRPEMTGIADGTLSESGILLKNSKHRHADHE